ncbi:MAG: hypothetical protein KC591_10940 [Gemmatimonadetes bacterium]|nr:hypothetical protein [Gemmatimonadota bacterium]
MERSPWFGLTLALLFLGGCGGPAAFVDREADLPYYERVGILPFDSLAQDALAGDKVASVFLTELLRRDFAQVLDPTAMSGAVTKVRGAGPNRKPWSSKEISNVAEIAEVQGVFVGTIRDYGMVPVGRSSYPLVSLEIRLVDATSGRIVWSASQTRRGGPALPLMGWREIPTLGELTAVMCRDLLETLR